MRVESVVTGYELYSGGRESYGSEIPVLEHSYAAYALISVPWKCAVGHSIHPFSVQAMPSKRSGLMNNLPCTLFTISIWTTRWALVSADGICAGHGNRICGVISWSLPLRFRYCDQPFGDSVIM